jgi:hypothetical protein
LRVGAVRANSTHRPRLASGNWSRKNNMLPVTITTAVCRVSTRAEIVSRPGTLRVRTLRPITVSQTTAVAASMPASRPPSLAPTR